MSVAYVTAPRKGRSTAAPLPKSGKPHGLLLEHLRRTDPIGHAKAGGTVDEKTFLMPVLAGPHIHVPLQGAPHCAATLDLDAYNRITSHDRIARSRWYWDDEAGEVRAPALRADRNGVSRMDRDGVSIAALICGAKNGDTITFRNGDSLDLRERNLVRLTGEES